DRTTQTLRFLDIPASSENSNYALQGQDGTIWLTTARGLHVLDASLQYLCKVDLPHHSPLITSGCILSDDRLLYATEEGLFTARYTPDSIEIKKYTDVFDGIFVAILYMDQTGMLWTGTENGIYRFDPVQKSLELYDYSDNIQGYGFNGNSYL